MQLISAVQNQGYNAELLTENQSTCLHCNVDSVTLRTGMPEPSSPNLQQCYTSLFGAPPAVSLVLNKLGCQVMISTHSMKHC